MSSRKQDHKLWIPRESPLGPLLFSLYINYIPQALLNSHRYLYSHNKSIFYQRKNITEIENVLIKN